MKIEVNITKKYFISILAVMFIIAGLIGVFAYSSGAFSKTVDQAKKFGHSADEIVVNVGGTDMTLQEAVASGKLVSTTTADNVPGGTTGSVLTLPIGSIVGGFITVPAAGTSNGRCLEYWGVATFEALSVSNRCTCPSKYRSVASPSFAATGSLQGGNTLTFCLIQEDTSTSTSQGVVVSQDYPELRYPRSTDRRYYVP